MMDFGEYSDIKVGQVTWLSGINVEDQWVKTEDYGKFFSRQVYIPVGCVVISTKDKNYIS